MSGNAPKPISQMNGLEFIEKVLTNIGKETINTINTYPSGDGKNEYIRKMYALQTELAVILARKDSVCMDDCFKAQAKALEFFFNRTNTEDHSWKSVGITPSDEFDSPAGKKLFSYISCQAYLAFLAYPNRRKYIVELIMEFKPLPKITLNPNAESVWKCLVNITDVVIADVNKKRAERAQSALGKRSAEEALGAAAGPARAAPAAPIAAEKVVAQPVAPPVEQAKPNEAPPPPVVEEKVAAQPVAPPVEQAKPNEAPPPPVAAAPVDPSAETYQMRHEIAARIVQCVQHCDAEIGMIKRLTLAHLNAIEQLWYKVRPHTRDYNDIVNLRVSIRKYLRKEALGSDKLDLGRINKLIVSLKLDQDAEIKTLIKTMQNPFVLIK